MTRGEKVIAFIGRYCVTPEGAHVGKPLVLADFQKQFIRDIYDNPHTTRRAYLSISRKNGKSGLIAAILLAHLVGPEALANSQIVSGAMSRDQAALVFALAAKMVQLSIELSQIVKIIPSSKRLIGLPRNVEYRALAADGTTAHGLSPVLAILDEVGQIKGPHSDFVDAITTSQGAHAAPLLIAISTQAPTEADLFSIWLDDAQASKDPKIVCHLYEAPKGCDLMDEAAWRAANPALGLFRSLDDLREQATQAMRMPSTENSFRNLLLNQRVEARSPFVSRTVWLENGSEPLELDPATPIYGGLDLSAVNDLTALVLLAAHEDGTFGVLPTFWLPNDGLAERSRQDRVPYDVWNREGYLETTPGASIQYEWVAHQLKAIFERYNVQNIAFDRYNMRFLRPWLEKVGFGEADLAKFIEFGQGFASMSPALRELESALLARKLRHGNHPVLTMCAQNATIQQDAAENRKFVKAKASGRIDGMVALAMAVGVMPLVPDDDTATFNDFLSNG